LVTADRWVRHSNKRPVTVDGGQASSTDPATWSSYRAAVRSNAGDGLGFVLGAGFACLDIDHCLWDDGTPDARAAAILEQVGDAYVEISPSGDGLHVWGRAPELPGRRTPGFEVYSAGRYMTVTGRTFRAGRLADLSAFF
jgi:primase-polymerase (primpol)-like protein